MKNVVKERTKFMSKNVTNLTELTVKFRFEIFPTMIGEKSELVVVTTN